MELEFKGELWEWHGQGAWCFLSVPAEYYADLKAISTIQKRGFGSIKVTATIGQTTWETSIFPDSKSGCYLLPVKKQVRKTENLNVGDIAAVHLRVL